jgi:hypothetical protein
MPHIDVLARTAQPIVAAVQDELRKHQGDTFVDDPPAVAYGGKSVMVPGCVTCRKKMNTIGEFMDHLSNDVLPGVIDAAAKQSI